MRQDPVHERNGGPFDGRSAHVHRTDDHGCRRWLPADGRRIRQSHSPPPHCSLGTTGHCGLAVDRPRLATQEPGFHATGRGPAEHRLDLLSARTSSVDPDLAAADTAWPMTSTTLWLAGREAVDAGAADTSRWPASRPGTRRAPRPRAARRGHRRRHRRRRRLALRPPIAIEHRPPPDRRRRPGRPRRRRRPHRELGREPAAPRRRPTPPRRTRLPMALPDPSRPRSMPPASSPPTTSTTPTPSKQTQTDRTSTGRPPPRTPAGHEASGNDRATAGPASPRPNSKSSTSSPTASPTPRSRPDSSWAKPPSRRISPTSSTSSESPPAPNSPAKPHGGAEIDRGLNDDPPNAEGVTCPSRIAGTFSRSGRAMR